MGLQKISPKLALDYAGSRSYKSKVDIRKFRILMEGRLGEPGTVFGLLELLLGLPELGQVESSDLLGLLNLLLVGLDLGQQLSSEVSHALLVFLVLIILE